MKLNLKVISIILILFFISLCAVSAEDTAQLNDKVSETGTNTTEIININEQWPSSLTVNSEGFYELQQLIWKTPTDDTIILTSDYAYDGQIDFISINRTITFDGNGHTLDGNSNAIFHVSNATNVVIKNTVFINGEGSWGGAIFGDEGSDYLTVYNCTFKDNKAISAGAVCLKSNYATITNCRFENNVADYGGAIHIDGGNSSIISKCRFISNKAKEKSGGAIYAEGNYMTITDNYFSNSSAGRNGGAVYIFGESPIITKNKFKNNSANKLAGALFLKSNNTNVNGNEFSKNSAETNGGAIYLEGENSKLTKNNFTNNHAGKLGGAIRFDGSTNTAELKDNTFKSNDAPSGGAIYAEGTKMTLSKNMFNSNKATSGSGGTLDIFDTSTTISGNTITNSTAKRSGGAIYIECETLTFTNNTISQCSCEEVGGAAYIKGTTTLNILNNIFLSNAAGKLAGAIFIKSNKSDIMNNEFMQNTAKSSGGAIRVEGNFHIISNNSFTENKGIGILGGAICSLGHNNRFTCNTFTGNLAGRDGGALFSEGSDIAEMGHNNSVTHNVFISNIVTGNPEGCHGGAISMAGEGCAINYNNFTDNHADNIGGAIRWNGADSAMGDIIGNRFERNDASSGGAMYITGHGINIAENTFNENEATHVGGSIDIGGNNAVISNNNMTNCKAETGGAIYINGKNSQLKNNIIKKSSVENDAGAIYITGASAIIKNNKFIDNTAGGLAGAALIKSDNGEINGNEFTGNSAKTKGGGAIYAEGNAMTLSQNIFKKHNASGLGGTINIKGASTIISCNEITDSYAKQHNAGGIYAKGENIQFEGNTITECHSQSNGGGAYLEGSGTVSKSSFISCSATNNGGGIYFTNTNFNLMGNTFKSNSAKNGADYYPTAIPHTKISAKLTATDACATYGSSGYIIATLTDNSGNPIDGASIGFENNGMKYITTGADGKAIYYTNELVTGTHSIKVTFNGNSIYYPAPSVTSNAIITKAFTVLTAEDISVAYNSCANITATLKDENGNSVSDAEIIFKIGSATLKAMTDANGVASASTDGITPKTYNADISFSGNNLYDGTTKTAKATIKKANTAIDSPDVSLTYADKNGALIATLINDESGKAISGVTVRVKINDEKYSLKTDSNGQIKVSTADLALGNYTATITYAGNSKYNPTSATANVSIIKADIIILTIYNNQDKKLIATLTNNKTGKAIVNANVKFDLNDMTTIVKSNAKGQAELSTAELPLGTYTATITYAGNSKYNPASTSATFSTKTDTIISAAYDAPNSRIVATLSSYDGKNLSNANVKVAFNGKTATIKTNSKGQAKLSLTGLPLGTYAATISYAGNGKYNPANTSISFDVTKMLITGIYGYSNKLKANITNGVTGSPIINANIVVDINGIKSTIRSDSKGQISLDTSNLGLTKYDVSISYAGNSRYGPSSTTTTIDLNKANMNIKYKYDADKKEISATLKNSKTGTVVSGANMAVNINGIKTTLKSNNKGQIIFSTADFTPGTYVGTISYAGNAKYNSITTAFKADV